MPTPGTRAAFALLALGSLLKLGCGGLVAPGPEPTLAFPKQPELSGDALGDFGINLRITAAVERHALRRPALFQSVDVQVEAMLAYARQHGRGALHEPSLPRERTPKTTAAEEYERLYTFAVHAMAHLGLERGPSELSRAALDALLQALGPDATLTRAEEASPGVASDLSFAQRDGVAFLALRTIDDEVGTRVAAVLSQWAASDAPPRAVIVDLSRCEDAEPAAAAMLVHVLAPGRQAFELEVRDEKTSALQRHAFHGDAEWSQAAYAKTPVFVVVSDRTASIAEAAAHALRHHRTAHVLGTPSAGDGRLMAWFELPDQARFAFTIGDVLGVDGAPLRDRRLVPDACRSGGGALTALTLPTEEQARAVCDGSLPTQDEAIDYARALLAAEAATHDATPAPASTPLQHGEAES